MKNHGKEYYEEKAKAKRKEYVDIIEEERQKWYFPTARSKEASKKYVQVSKDLKNILMSL